MKQTIFAFAFLLLLGPAPGAWAGNRSTAGIDATGVTPKDVSPSGLQGGALLTKANAARVLEGKYTVTFGIASNPSQYKVASGNLYYRDWRGWRSLGPVENHLTFSGASSSSWMCYRNQTVVVASGVRQIKYNVHGGWITTCGPDFTETLYPWAE